MPFYLFLKVNKQKFNTYLRKPEKLTSEELNSLSNLSEQYPYSQVLHTLVAKAYIVSGSKKAKDKLNYAAIYATDRAILKNFLNPNNGKPSNTSPSTKKIITKEKDKTKHAHQIKHPRTIQTLPKSNTNSNHELEMEKLRADIMLNLDELVYLKEKVNFKDFENHEIPSSEQTNMLEEINTYPVENSEKNNPNQDEQFQIIETFIKLDSPIKPSGKQKEGEQNDLTEKNENFHDDLISENLAVILTGQGKITRAIEIYKKLIWKYPQKKAYFAAQIESLEK